MWSFSFLFFSPLLFSPGLFLLHIKFTSFIKWAKLSAMINWPQLTWIQRKSKLYFITIYPSSYFGTLLPPLFFLLQFVTTDDFFLSFIQSLLLFSFVLFLPAILSPRHTNLLQLSYDSFSLLFILSLSLSLALSLCGNLIVCKKFYSDLWIMKKATKGDSVEVANECMTRGLQSKSFLPSNTGWLDREQSS